MKNYNYKPTNFLQLITLITLISLTLSINAQQMPSKLYIYTKIDAKKSSTFLPILKTYFNQTDSILMIKDYHKNFYENSFNMAQKKKFVEILFYANKYNYNKIINLMNSNKRAVVEFSEEIKIESDSKYFNFNVDTNEIHNEIIRYIKLIKSNDSLLGKAPLNNKIELLLNENRNFKHTVNRLKNDLEKIRFSNKYGYEIRITIYENYKKTQYEYGVEWEDYFMPGISYNYLKLSSNDSLKSFSGIAPEFTFYSRYKSNAKGPSVIKSYIKMGILNNDNKSNGVLFSLAIGTNCSFESNVHRSFFIPYFGAEIGHISQRKIGSSFFIQPNLGIHLYSSKRILISAQSNYLYALKNTQAFQNASFSLGFNCLLWE